MVPKFAGSNPAEAVAFFRAKKILSTPSFGREVKQFVPCRIFEACKRTRKFMRGSRSFRSKLPAISRPSISSFHYWGLWWRHLTVQVGTTEDQGLYNKPLAAVHPGALAAGTLPHNKTCRQFREPFLQMIQYTDSCYVHKRCKFFNINCIRRWPELRTPCKFTPLPTIHSL